MAKHKLATIAVDVDVSNVDWKLLRQQKSTLLALCPTTRREYDAFIGVVHLIDYIQDKAAEQLGEYKVFGRKPRE